jgi:hypothetical protein
MKAGEIRVVSRGGLGLHPPDRRARLFCKKDGGSGERGWETDLGRKGGVKESCVFSPTPPPVTCLGIPSGFVLEDVVFAREVSE